MTARSRLGRVLRYTFGAALCLLAGINVLIGSAWYLSLGIAATGGIIPVGQRRIFRAGVSRSGDEIVCRYIPWYEGNAYTAVLLIPLMGVAMVGAASAVGNPVWLRYGGIFLLRGATPLVVYGIVRMWRRSLLGIALSMLTVRLAERGSELIEIRREQVESIEPKRVRQPVSGEWLQVAITHRTNGIGGDATNTVILGLRLTVRPGNLFNALVAWRDGADDKLDRAAGPNRANPSRHLYGRRITLRAGSGPHRRRDRLSPWLSQPPPANSPPPLPWFRSPLRSRC